MRGPPPMRVLVAVGVVAGSTLALQVLLTRIYSASLFYHFAFLAISLALLGGGSGALLVYLRPRWFERAGTESTLAGWCAAFSGALIIVPILAVRIEFGFQNDLTAAFALKLAALATLSAVPFFAAGVVIALAIKNYVSWIGRVYAFDLAGAGLGAVAIVPLLWSVSPPVLVGALGVLCGLAAALFAGPDRSRRNLAAGVAVSGSVLIALSAATSLYHLDPKWIVEADPIADRWTPLARVVGYPPGDGAPTAVTYDRDAATVPPFGPGLPHPDWRELELGPQSVGYELTGPGDVLVIGGGGGRDIHNALSSGQSSVDVIELNRAIREVVDEDLSEFSGSPYSLPRVQSTIGDGRSTLAARETTYDQIHIGFTNTLSATAGSSFALSEANLYTLEAFDEYFDHLRPGGVLNLSRLRKLAGEEALRATVLTLKALERRGVPDPSKNVVVLLGHGVGGPFGTVLARIEPYSAAELNKIRRLAEQRGDGVAFAPGGPYQGEWQELARSSDVDSFCADYYIDVCPPTDDKPFFFQVTRLGDIGPSPLGYIFSPNPFLVLIIVVAILAVLSALAFIVPLAVVRDSSRPPASSLLFFGAIGVGFLVMEIVLIQRFVLFLGFPTYALSVVLFSLLLFTGLGSLASSRWRDSRRALIVALSVGAAFIAASALWLQPLLRAAIDLSFTVRVILTVALLAPLGLCLGAAMPIGLRRLAGLYPAGVSWAWGINGITSVLASALGVAVAITFGFSAATVLALACYLGALAHVVLGRWPSAQPSGSARL